MPGINRRNLLKALSAAGAAATVPAGIRAASRLGAGRHTAVYIDTRHGMYSGGSVRQIVNHGNRPLVLNGHQPVTVRNSGSDTTTLYLNTPSAVYTLQPGERLPVYAQAVMTNPPAPSALAGSLPDNAVSVFSQDIEVTTAMVG